MKLNQLCLVADPNREAAGRVAASMESQGLPRPVLVTNADDAVFWAAEYELGACVLTSELPPLGGVETLIRIHQRKPGLPVVIISTDNSAEVVIAAFRAGAADVFPMGMQTPSQVAGRLATLLQGDETESPPTTTPPHDLPMILAQPTYQNRLRVIGRQIDLYRYRSLNIAEVAGGFMVRALAPEKRHPEGLEFADRDFTQALVGAYRARGQGERRALATTLLPTGYEDFLRALGRVLDERHAEAVTITELGTVIAVGGVNPLSTEDQATVEPFHLILDAATIEQMIADSSSLRAPVPVRQGIFRRPGRRTS